MKGGEIMDPQTIDKHKELLLQFSYECVSNSEQAIRGYNKYKNVAVSLQFMNQAFQCVKFAQYFYLQNYQSGEIQEFEQFFHQFGILNQEFLNRLQTNSDLQWSYIELKNLENIFNELKIRLSD
jgi:hypothetical protein